MNRCRQRQGRQRQRDRNRDWDRKINTRGRKHGEAEIGRQRKGKQTKINYT